MPLEPNTNPAEVGDELRRQNIKTVIALGNLGWRSTAKLDKDVQVVVGGLLKMPESSPKKVVGISWITDPIHMFRQLKTFQPGVKNVHVVFNAQTSGWLIKQARESARQVGLELVAVEVNDLAGAAHTYESIFASAVAGRDALWLLQDSSTVDEVTVLSLLLQQSWNHGIPIFSSNVAHVKRGTLFAAYPNNVELGRALVGKMGSAASNDGAKADWTLSQSVSTAVNTRTAAHLGITLSEQQQRQFAAVFPEP
jgi:putative ABC transport system substrate-binding protein